MNELKNILIVNFLVGFLVRWWFLRVRMKMIIRISVMMLGMMKCLKLLGRKFIRKLLVRMLIGVVMLMMLDILLWLEMGIWLGRVVFVVVSMVFMVVCMRYYESSII